MRKIRKLKKIFTQGWILLKFIYYRIYCFIKKPTDYKNYWLISERGVDARDNGYVFFKYIKDNYPNIKVKYVITRNSPDFYKIEKLKDYVIYGSKEHFIAFLTSKLLISAHIMGFSPDMGLFVRLMRYNLVNLKGKIVWLQHGVIASYLDYAIPKYTKLSLLITSSSREREFLINRNGYSEDIVKCTGLARFDNLKNVKSKQILFMPTFRKYMHYMKDDEFIKTDYYIHINGLINNSYLIDLLEKKDLTLIFYIHYEFQKYSHLFSPKSKRIVVARIMDYDVQQLLINSMLLITDYSSVSFDFAYMKKPIIYYQFDYEDFRKLHYDEGYFLYEKDGFGPVAYNEDDVIKNIKINIKNKFKISKETENKINTFFPFFDCNNCERIYNEIKNIERN